MRNRPTEYTLTVERTGGRTHTKKLKGGRTADEWADRAIKCISVVRVTITSERNGVVTELTD